jgi:hypothetical protein
VIIYDNFLSNAEKVAAEFPAFNSDAWFEYNNPIEVKKTCNNWHHFGPETYKTFQYLLSKEFTDGLEDAFGVSLIPDLGLHGGGLHTHARGGKLNVHLDYDIHPKLELQRYLNLIIYLTPGWKPEWGGGLGMWEDPKMQLSYLKNMIRELLARWLSTIGRAALSASQFVAPKMQVPLTSLTVATLPTVKPRKRSPRAIHSKTIGANQLQRHSNSKGGASQSRKPKTTSES